jgi:CRP/FNR family transcriptional regulator, anaerobic regulatory protein
MEELFLFMQTLYPLSDDLRNHLVRTVKVKDFRRGDYLLKQGRIPEYVYFIKRGLVRSYYINVDFSEVSLRFAKPGDVIYSVTPTILTQYAGIEIMQALEETEVYYVSYTELHYIYKQYPEFNYVGRVLAEHNIASLVIRLYILQLPTAVQRYQTVMDKFPELVQQVPLKYLASYLGITEQSLSRIRNSKRNN